MRVKLINLLLICVLFLAAGTLLWAGKKKMPNEISIIRQGLTDPDLEVRSASVEILAKLHDTDSLPEIKKLLMDKSDSLKIKTAVAMAKLGDRSGITEIRKILNNAPVLSEKPTSMERVKAIMRGTVRAEAAYALGEINDVDSKPVLQKWVDDDDGRVGDACMVSLAKMGDKSIKDEFLSALESTKQGVRAKAAQILCDIGDTTCFTGLRKRSKDWDKDVKGYSILALGKLKDTESMSAIRELLWDKDDTVREKAVLALGYMGNTEAIGALKETLQDANGFVRITASKALHMLGDDSGKDFLIRVLKTDDKDAKLRALNALDGMVKPEDVPVLQQLAAGTDKLIAVKAAGYLTALKMEKQ